jgi:hypothetical protein
LGNTEKREPHHFTPIARGCPLVSVYLYQMAHPEIARLSPVTTRPYPQNICLKINCMMQDKIHKTASKPVCLCTHPDPIEVAKV